MIWPVNRKVQIIVRGRLKLSERENWHFYEIEKAGWLADWIGSFSREMQNLLSNRPVRGLTNWFSWPNFCCWSVWSEMPFFQNYSNKNICKRQGKKPAMSRAQTNWSRHHRKELHPHRFLKSKNPWRIPYDTTQTFSSSFPSMWIYIFCSLVWYANAEPKISRQIFE